MIRICLLISSVVLLATVPAFVNCEEYSISSAKHVWYNVDSESTIKVTASNKTGSVSVFGSCDSYSSTVRATSADINRYYSKQLESYVTSEFSLYDPLSPQLSSDTHANGHCERGDCLFFDSNYHVNHWVPRMRILDLSSRFGNIHVENVNVRHIKASTTSGDISLKGCPYTDRVEVKAISGDILIRDCNLSGNVASTSGSVRIENSVISSGRDISFKAVSGGISLVLDCAKECGNVDIHTVSGDIRLILLHTNGKTYSLKTVSGDISIAGQRGRGMYRSGKVQGGGLTSISLGTVSGGHIFRF